MNNVQRLQVKIANKYDEFCYMNELYDDMIINNRDWRDFKKALRLLYNAQLMFNGYKGSYYEYLKLEYNDWCIKLQDTKDVLDLMEEHQTDTIAELWSKVMRDNMVDCLDFN